eukprot:4284375-Alexandrium_andersonii.AAC.1
MPTLHWLFAFSGQAARAALSRVPRLCRSLKVMVSGAHCLGAVLWALGRALGLFVLVACLSVANRLAAADGGLKLHTRCASLAPEFFEAVRDSQDDCRACWSTIQVRLSAGGLTACQVLGVLCDIIIGRTLQPYAFPPP